MNTYNVNCGGGELNMTFSPDLETTSKHKTKMYND